MLIIISEISDHGNNTSVKTLTRIAMVLALGVPISICIKLYFERFSGVKPILKIVIYTLSAAFLLVYYYFYLPDENMVPVTRYIAFNITFYLIVLSLPYFYKRENFEVYIIKMISNFIITLVFSLVIFLGISAILFTIEKLFDVNVYNKLYLYTWITIAGVFAPSYFLSAFPEYTFEFDKSNYSKFLKVLLLYILMPILSVYTLILYLYLFKVMATAKWPVGIVGNLVLWYSLISTLVIFLVWPLLLDNKWVKTFIFWFTKLIFPLVIIMFVSLGIRIRAYGITEKRYFVIILALWVLGIMLYWNFRKNRRNIILPITLSAITFLSVVGPWSAYSISIYSQNKRFENIVSKYNMISNNKLVKPAGPVSGDDEKELIAIISYFSSNHSLKDIKYLPAGFSTNNMKNIFGFEYNPNFYDPNNMKYFSYYLNNIDKPFDVSGYDYLFSFKPKGIIVDQTKDKLRAEYNYQNHRVTIYSDKQVVYQNDFTNTVEKLYSKYDINGNMNISQEDMTFTDENSNLKVEIIIYGIFGNRNSSEEFKIDSVEFDILVKMK
jgi:hypothetical protein